MYSNLALMILISSIMLGLGCGNKNFVSGSKASKEKAPDEAAQEEKETITPKDADKASADAQPQEDGENEGDPEEGEAPVGDKPLEADEIVKLCTEKLESEVNNVLTVDEINTDAANSDFILFVDLSGGNNIDLQDKLNGKKIKALCIEAGGNAQFSAVLYNDIDSLFVFGQGTPDVFIDFQNMYTIKEQVILDIGGNASINLLNSADCEVKSSTQGSSKLTCNGDKIN